MECRREQIDNCSCTYPGCSKRNLCCECLSYHLKMKELPACCFPADAEKNYDRSFKHFAKLVKENII